MSREALTWLLAALVHLAIPVVAAFAPLSARPLLALASGALRGTEIDIEAVANPLREKRAGHGPAEAEPGDAPARIDARLRSKRVASRATDAPEEPSSPEAPPVPGGASSPPIDDYGPPADDGRDAVLAPGVGGTPVWAIPGAVARPDLPRPAPTAPGAPRVTDRDAAGRVLRDAQAAKDKAIGIDLPAAGTVAAVIAEAVRTTGTPQVGRATYEVRLGPRGQVLGVRLLRATGGAADGWEKAAKLAALRLGQHKLAMSGAFTSGAMIVVDVSSIVQLPAGPPNGAVKPGPPPGMAGGGASFDLANIGARPSRVVTTSFRTRPL